MNEPLTVSEIRQGFWDAPNDQLAFYYRKTVDPNSSFIERQHPGRRNLVFALEQEAAERGFFYALAPVYIG